MLPAPCQFKEFIRELYEPSQIGALVLSNVLTPDTRFGVEQELKENSRNYIQDPTQSFKRWDFKREAMKNYSALSVVDIMYEQLAREIHSHIPCSQAYSETRVSSSYYPERSQGVKPHQDTPFSVNFVAIFVVSGTNEFCVARNKDRQGEIRLRSEPGDVILMRAPRSIAEDTLRPVHYVEDIVSDRYIIIYREINIERLHKTVDSQSRY